MTDPARDRRLLMEARRADPERVEAALLAGPDARRRLISLYAVNQEVAKAWESVSQPTIGLMRLQWWREALEAAVQGGPIRRHDAAEALAELVADAPEIAPLLAALIEARERDFDETPFADDAAFYAYLDATAGGLIEAALRSAFAVDPSRARELAKPLGRAWGAVGLVRAMPHHLARRRLSAPTTAFLGDPERAFAAHEADALTALRNRMLEQAAKDLEAARTAFQALPAMARPAALYGAVLPKLIRKLRDADPFAIPWTPGPIQRRWAITIAASMGRI